MVETKAPQNFEIMTPIDFVIEAGEVTFVTSAGKDSVVNQALGTISVTKYDDHSLYIGDENDNEQLKDFSVITFKHRYQNKDLGTIGIIGPKRMDYSKVISVMKYINKKLKEIE